MHRALSTLARPSPRSYFSFSTPALVAWLSYSHTKSSSFIPFIAALSASPHFWSRSHSPAVKKPRGTGSNQGAAASPSSSWRALSTRNLSKPHFRADTAVPAGLLVFPLDFRGASPRVSSTPCPVSRIRRAGASKPSLHNNSHSSFVHHPDTCDCIWDTDYHHSHARFVYQIDHGRGHVKHWLIFIPLATFSHFYPFPNNGVHSQ